MAYKTVFCQIHGTVNGTEWQGELVCPYHQRVAYDSDGVPYRMYDEFNDDGEEW